jgi:hypothetical protein
VAIACLGLSAADEDYAGKSKNQTNVMFWIHNSSYPEGDFWLTPEPNRGLLLRR